MKKFFRAIAETFKYKKFLSDEGRNMKVLTESSIIILIVIGIAYVVIDAYTSMKPGLTGGDIALIILKPIVVLAIGVISSLLVSVGISYFLALIELKKKDDLATREKFSNFFGCEINNGEDDPEKDNVVIILPRYKNIKLANDYTAIEQEISNKIKSNGKHGFTKSIKTYRTSTDNSFSQSDTIAAANIVATFAKFNMQLPKIRTDLQGLSKIFQYDESNSELTFEETLERINSYFQNEDLNDIVSQDELRSIISKRSVAGRFYKTYISIGMFSNAFLMDLINDKINEGTEKPFTCVARIGHNGFVERCIEIHNAESSVPYATNGLKIDDKEFDNDFALIAGIKFMNRNVIICAGITKAGTEAAALYLTMKWKKIFDEIRNIDNKNFAIVIEVDKNKASSKFLKNKNPIYNYPKNLFNNIGNE